jgi:DNA repair protein RecN (Recombination protein N)
MIKKLHIVDFAIVADLTVEFYDGLNILSGETGAGKSVIIGALNLLLGERAQIEMIRSGKEMATVEGHFRSTKTVSSLLKKISIESESDMIEIRREIKRNSSSRCFINGQMVTLADQKTIGQKLVDLVGQHHQQLLLDSGNHIFFLDDFAGNQKLLDEYRNVYRLYQSSKTELSDLQRKITREKEKMELYRFQLQDINTAKLSIEEEDDLLKEKQLLENAENLKSAYYQISENLYQGENSATETLTDSLTTLDPLKKYDQSLEEVIKSIKGSLYSLQEAGRFLESRSHEIEHDPERLKSVEQRLDTYYNLKRKYGGSLDELFTYRDKINDSLSSFSDWSGQLEKLTAEVNLSLDNLYVLAEKLSDKRQKSAKKLARQVEKALESLLMGKVRFNVNIAACESQAGEYQKEEKTYILTSDGFDNIEFQFSPNPGEELKSLAKIASGGELSRVLLALKTIVSSKASNSCLIFDEIDSGIGGKTASAVGRSLQKLSAEHQVLVITHLQQIAAVGDNHFMVFKEQSNGRMIARIKQLSPKERKEEIGRMISGDKITKLSLQQAEELLQDRES